MVEVAEKVCSLLCLFVGGWMTRQAKQANHSVHRGGRSGSEEENAKEPDDDRSWWDD